ncbi:endonuclease domain-containing protein [Streptomyces microflavus]|uniref:endonuclease domain-containing protein n=1 Tax=Streptomyces microflavus TaxID=1919 RepID=UPI0029B409A3|nr:endonuclease domain-containing protein [Streptomyces microflavus]MDX2404589.1 endonuclease VII domain-containing protein [Streptomyces microflavus]
MTGSSRPTGRAGPPRSGRPRYGRPHQLHAVVASACTRLYRSRGLNCPAVHFRKPTPADDYLCRLCKERQASARDHCHEHGHVRGPL